MVRRKLTGAALGSLALLLVAAAPVAAAVSVSHTRCESRLDPLGIDVLRPRLSWVLTAQGRGQHQSAYRILAARTPAALREGRADLWDSGKVMSDQSTFVPYAGTDLVSRDRVFWTVKVWDKNGAPSAYSDPAKFEIGLLTKAEWRAQWIGLAPRLPTAGSGLNQVGLNWIWCGQGTTCDFKKTFDLSEGDSLTRATMIIGADAELRLSINGKEIAQDRGPSRLLQIDVTNDLIAGKNTINVVAARKQDNGGLVATLQIERKDAPPLRIVTDASWKGAASIVPAPRHGVGLPIVPLNAPPAFLRKSFSVAAGIRQARLYVTALGLYEMSLNGHRVGSHRLAPGWTDYNKRVAYQTYDVTALVRKGENVLGAIVGDGWYAGKLGWQKRKHNFYGEDPPRLLAQLEIITTSGRHQRMVSDASWTGSTGPLVASDLFDGETYDARLETPGWDKPGFSKAGFRPATEYDESGRNLVADPGPAIRITNNIKAAGIKEPKPGVWVFDLGQNMAGWARFSARAPAGTTATLRFAEVLNDDGTIYTANLRSAKATDRYTFKGVGQEIFEPRFTYHGFRYVEVTGLPSRPGLGTIQGRVLHSDNPATGSFETSNPTLNKLQANILWGQRSNFISVPTDCPQRNQRLGAMADAQIFARTACFNEDVLAFYTKWIGDVRDGQSLQGAFPEVAPRMGPDFRDGSPGWGDAGIMVPWVAYQCYGDRRLLEDQYSAMTRWIHYIRGANPDLLWTKQVNFNTGDKEAANATSDKDVLATAFFANSTHLLSRIARAIGKTDDADNYERLFDSIKSAFNRAYVTADGRIKSETQTVYALALRFSLLPPALRSLAAKHLVADIEKHDNHLTTGFLGTGHLLPALTVAGRNDLAYKLLLTQTRPSWLYSIKQGATTLWERWDGFTHDKGFQTPGANSFNHYAFGAVGEWMYTTIGGIDADPEKPGYKHILIRPRPGGGLTSARTSYDSPYGRISTDWMVDGQTFRLKVTIPANTTATVILPTAFDVREGGKPIADIPQISGVRKNGGETTLSVGSGTYDFLASP